MEKVTRIKEPFICIDHWVVAFQIPLRFQLHRTQWLRDNLFNKMNSSQESHGLHGGKGGPYALITDRTDGAMSRSTEH